MPAGVAGGNTINIGASSSLEAVNLSALPRPGELGQRVYGTANKEYQAVQLDSGATAATAAGITARGHVLYWKDKVNYIVTNDAVAAIGANSVLNGSNNAFRNEVAGICMLAVTAGNYTLIQNRGNMSAVKAKTATFNIGYEVVADTTAAQVDAVAAGTALTVTSIGKAAAIASGTSVSVDLNLPQVP